METPDVNTSVDSSDVKKPRFKTWFYRVLFALIAIAVVTQYASTSIIAKDLETELNKGFDGIKFKQVVVKNGLYEIQVSAQLVPQNRFNKIDYVDLIQDLDMNVNVFSANLDKVKQLLNQSSEFEQYTLVGHGTLKGDDYEGSLTAEFLANGDFMIKSETAEDMEIAEEDDIVMLYSEGESYSLTRKGGAVDLSYQSQPVKLYTEYGVFSAQSIRYAYNTVDMPELSIEGFKLQSGTHTLGDLFRGKNEGEEASAIFASLTLKGLDVDTLVYAFTIYEDLENLDEGNFKRTKLESDLQALAMRLVENSVSLKSELSLIDRGSQTDYEIKLTMQSSDGINSYEDMITAISGDIARIGERPSAKHLKTFDKLLSGLSEKSDNLRYRALAMQ